MNLPSLPNDISRVLLMSDGVFVWTSPEVAPKVRLAFDGLECSLQSIHELGREDTAMPKRPNVPSKFMASFPLIPDVIEINPPLTDANSDIEIMLNQLHDWKLIDHDTLQMCIDSVPVPTEIKIANPMSLPASKEALEAQVLVALHRCFAEVKLTIYQENADPVVMFQSVDHEKFGGQDRYQYCSLAFDIPPSDYERSIELSIVYNGLREADAEQLPYIFVTDATVRTATDGKEPEGLYIMGTDDGAAACYFSEIAIGALPNSASIELVSPMGKAEILPPTNNTVKLLDDVGHKLLMTAETPGKYSVYLDGKKAMSADIGPQAEFVYFPTTVLTGEFHALTVKDQWGLRTFLRGAHLTPRVLTPQDVMQQESRAPFPSYLTGQSVPRYDAVKAHLSNGTSPDVLAQLGWAIEVVEGGYANVNLKPISFPVVKNPKASVIIPAHNKVEVTYLALCALLLAHNKTSFEIILVDDASTDETAEIEKLVSGIKVIRNKQAQRFIRACNAGVEKAQGEFVVLLNNDTEVTVGWLDALIDGFDIFDDVGLVGSKLLYPNGQLQDGGGIIWKNGEPWNYGKFSNPWEPRFSYARQVDYLCGAALMTTKEIWDEVGGLSSYLEPMYFEDTDLAFKIRDAGYKTYFIPSSVVYHYEGMTSGTDVADNSSAKRYQEINSPKFKRRWARAYENFRPEGLSPDLEKDRGIVGRVLFVDHAIPRPDQDAGSYAAVQEMRLVQSLGFKVTFLPENFASLGAYDDELNRLGIEVICAPFYRSVEDYLERHGPDFDAFYITRYKVAERVIDKMRHVAPRAKILFNNADLHFLREMRAALMEDDPDRMVQVRKVRDQELAIMREADVVLSYNVIEHAVITSHTEGAATVVKAPWVVELPKEIPPVKSRSGLSFLGNYKHPPNAEGIEWFVRTVMPLVQTAVPDAKLSIYGARMPETIKALESQNVLAKGFVENTSDAYNPHKIFVAPLLSGAGIKGKVVAALAHGIPCVLTPVAAEGIGLRHGLDCMIATDPKEWVDAISELYGDPSKWLQISNNARTYVEETFSMVKGRQELRAAFEAVDIYNSLD